MSALAKKKTAPSTDLAPAAQDAHETPPPAPAIEDVPVKIAAVLGKTKIDVAKLKTLGDGAVIELDRKVGEPIDLYVNDRLIARGELVMKDGVLGVTMTEIVRDDDI